LINYLLEAADSLDYVHREGFVHGDLQPDSIFLLNGHVKVGGVGRARAMTGLSFITIRGSTIPLYVPPETAISEWTASCDQYTLACTYVEVRLMANSSASFPDNVLNPLPADDLPEAEQDVLLKALAPDPTQRYPNCRAFAVALQNAS
jgi:serine/threonine-protein kinase